MPRRKVSMGLIPNRRVRANTFAKRKEGLKKKARELATLCAVRVAVVCSPADDDGAGTGAADVWESAPGVLDAYRDVPAEERAKHTHAAYAEMELRKAEAKLVKVRQEGPAALAPWDAAVYALTLDEAQRLLGAVDDALRAVDGRRAALGLPPTDVDAGGGGGGGGWLKGLPAPAVPSDAICAPPLPPFAAGRNNLVMSVDELLLRAHGNSSNNSNEQQAAVWDNNAGFDSCRIWQPSSGYAFHPQCTAVDMVDGGYKQIIAADVYGSTRSSSIGRLPFWDALFHPPTNAAAMQQGGGYGSGFVECPGTGDGYVHGMPSYDDQQLQQQQVATSNAMVPLGYHHPSSSFLEMMGLLAGGSNFNAALPPPPAALSLTMGTDNFINNAAQAQPFTVSCYNGGDLVMSGSQNYKLPWHVQSAGSSKPIWEVL